MRKICFLFILASAACFAQVPQWVKNPEKAYPSSDYIRGVGEATSVKGAQSAAIADISLFFDAKTDVLSVAVKQSNAVFSGENGEFSSSQSFQQVANISSTAEFFGLNFTDAYYDKKSDRYTVLAYINKNDAVKIYTSRIQSLMDSVNAYCDYAEREKEPFLQVDALSKAQKIAALAEQYIKAESVIVPDDAQKFQDSLKKIAQLPAECAALKSKMSFSITLIQKEKVFAPLFSTVAQILESHGYAYSVSGQTYQIIIDAACTEEQYEAGPFVRASVDVLIVNNDGNGVYTYSKAFPRIGSTTMEQAYTRTITKIKQDLEENFLSE